MSHTLLNLFEHIVDIKLLDSLSSKGRRAMLALQPLILDRLQQLDRDVLGDLESVLHPDVFGEIVDKAYLPTERERTAVFGSAGRPGFDNFDTCKQALQKLLQYRPDIVEALVKVADTLRGQLMPCLFATMIVELGAHACNELQGDLRAWMEEMRRRLNSPGEYGRQVRPRCSSEARAGPAPRLPLALRALHVCLPASQPPPDALPAAPAPAPAVPRGPGHPAAGSGHHQ